jgi:hypothetical protein
MEELCKPVILDFSLAIWLLGVGVVGCKDTRANLLVYAFSLGLLDYSKTYQISEVATAMLISPR